MARMAQGDLGILAAENMDVTDAVETRKSNRKHYPARSSVKESAWDNPCIPACGIAYGTVQYIAASLFVVQPMAARCASFITTRGEQ